MNSENKEYNIPRNKPGRKTKYNTIESKILANREKSKRYYYKNKKTICENRMRRYYSNKQKQQVMENV